MKTTPPSESISPLLNGSRKSRIDVGIEIGTSKVCVAVGKRRSDGSLNVMGIGQAPSLGVRDGVIADPDLAVRGLREALRDAEMKSDVVIGSASLALSGEHISSFHRRLGIDIADDPGEVEESDCQLLWERARETDAGEERAVLQSISQFYGIDGRKEILPPVGSSAHRLEAEFHIVTAPVELIETARCCVEKCGVEVEDMVFAPIASARALLSEVEKKEGALVIDIGAGTVDYVVYLDGLIRQSGALAVGEGQRGDGRERGMLEIIKNKISGETRLKSLAAGLVLTGGGSLRNGAGPLAREICGLPVRLAQERTFAGLDDRFMKPQYSTALGLLCGHHP